MAYGLRKMELFLLVVFSVLVTLYDAHIESHEPWYLLRIS
jgi:hypothetical protein